VDDVSFEIEKGELCVILGPSGAGKTTILNLLGGMDTATSGRIYVGGKEITALKGAEVTDYRRLDVGFVFQFYNLMPSLTALENVELARQVCPNALDPRRVMEQVGLGGRLDNFPAQLSGKPDAPPPPQSSPPFPGNRCSPLPAADCRPSPR